MQTFNPAFGTSNTGWAGGTVSQASVTNPQGNAETMTKLVGVSGSTMFAEWTFPGGAQNLSGIEGICVEFEVDFATYAVAGSSGRPFTVKFYDNGAANTVAAVVRIKQGWNRIFLSKEDFTTVGGAGAWDTTSFIGVQFRFGAIASLTPTVYFRGFYTIRKPTNRPLLAIRFDDIGSTHYTVAFPALKAANLVGTFAVISDAIDGAPYTGYTRCTTAQLQEMRDNGMAFANHTKSHQLAVLPTDTQANIYTEINTCKTAMDGKRLPGGDVIVWPYGEFGTNMNLAADQLGSAIQFGTVYDDSTLSAWPGGDAILDKRQCMCYYILGNSAGTSITTVATIKAQIDSWLRHGGYLVLIYHHIGIIGVNAAIEVPAADFQSVIDYLVTKRNQFDSVSLAQLAEYIGV